ncbi:MAG: DegT/DnrJ/EryC1/StrS family aminotransferase [Solirubrobacteraceae bacterium]
MKPQLEIPGTKSQEEAAQPPIPLFNLTLGLEPIRAEAVAVFERLWSTGGFTFGAELVEFEQAFADFCGASHCVGVSDGTTALQLGLLALDVPAGNRVITVPNTFVATVEAIAAIGARPTLVDVDPIHRCLDPDSLRAHFDNDVAAVVPVHLYGRLAPMDEIIPLCAARGVPVLEDAAQAHGASLKGRRAGTWGDAAAFSFYPSKNLGAAGDAGAVVSENPHVADAVRSLRHHGSAPGEPNRHVRVGRTARLDNLQAGLLQLRLNRLEQENGQRRTAAALYRELLAGLPVVLPEAEPADEYHVHHLFVVEVDERDRVLEELRAGGIGASIHYPTPIHLQPAYRYLGYAPGDFPVAERLAQTSLSLPCFPGITESQQTRVAHALARACKEG